MAFNNDNLVCRDKPSVWNGSNVINAAVFTYSTTDTKEDVLGSAVAFGDLSTLGTNYFESAIWVGRLRVNDVVIASCSDGIGVGRVVQFPYLQRLDLLS